MRFRGVVAAGGVSGAWAKGRGGVKSRCYAVATASGKIEVVARRWWHPADRRATRLAARMLSHLEPQIEADTARLVAQEVMYGQVMRWRP